MRFKNLKLIVLVVFLLFTAFCQAKVRYRKPIRPTHRKAPVVKGSIHHKPHVAKRVVRPPVGSRRITVGGVSYWIYAGVYYRHDLNDYFIVSAPAIKILPRHHRVIVVSGRVYYVADNVYYKAGQGGYIVVEKPVKVITAKATPLPNTSIVTKIDSTTLTLYVPKQNGSGFKPVLLKRLEGGYLGPQGEFYPAMPTIDLLSRVYGIDEKLRLVRADALFIHVPEQVGDGFVRVELKRHNRGYIGPQGEFYPIMPTVARLTEMYGGPQEKVSQDDQIKIKVAKKDGSGLVEIILKKSDTGYLGPQGEFYPELPNTSRLVEMYGN